MPLSILGTKQNNNIFLFSLVYINIYKYLVVVQISRSVFFIDKLKIFKNYIFAAL